MVLLARIDLSKMPAGEGLNSTNKQLQGGMELFHVRLHITRPPEHETPCKAYTPRSFKIARPIKGGGPKRGMLLSLAQSYSVPAPVSKLVWQSAAPQSSLLLMRK